MATSDICCKVLDWEHRWRESVERYLSQKLGQSDAAHDLAHVLRVVANSKRLMLDEQADPLIVLPAAWLHDGALVAKDSPAREFASHMASQQSVEFLYQVHYPHELIPAIAHAIEAHSFSAGIEPQTIEAKVVQDADRLDALGAIGIARCFLTAGAMQSQLYSADEPFPINRPLDDRQFAIDHFFKKLLLLPDRMQTATGRELGRQRANYLINFLKQFASEAVWDCTTSIDKGIIVNRIIG